MQKRIKIIPCIYYLDGRNWIYIVKVVYSLCASALLVDFELQLCNRTDIRYPV